MITISIMNLKGGVAKTITALNVAHILATKHGKRVLLIDNDKQGNSSKFFGLHGADLCGIADVLTEKAFDIHHAIMPTQYSGLDIMPADMSLLQANKEILMDCTRQQQTRLARALSNVADAYDYVIIDNAPDLNMTTINALVASDQVIIPIKIDQFAFDGLELLQEQINDVREYFNPNIKIAGCVITMYQRTNVGELGVEYLRTRANIPIFQTIIRKTVKIVEMTYTGVPITDYAPKSTAARDYAMFVDELLVTEINTNRGIK